MPTPRVLQAYNLHRGGGGADNATLATVAVLREHGVEVRAFERDSGSLGDGIAARLRAFADGLYARGAVSEFAALLDGWRPSLVHVHELFPLISPWVLPACTRRGIPVVMSCYDYRLTCPVATHFSHGAVCTRCAERGEHWAVLRNCRGRIAESVAYASRSALARRRRLFRDHVARCLAPTAFTARWLEERAGFPPERIAVVPLAVDIPAEPTDPSRGTYVAFAGRMVPEKGLEVLLGAARRTGLPVRIAGDRDHHPAVRAADPVELVSLRGRAQLDGLYRGARMLVVPSLWFETYPLVVAEAMSHGVPVVASRIGALPDTVRDGETGLLFEPGDERDLARQMLRLWQDAELCRRLGAAARRQTERLSHPRSHYERLMSVYHQVLA